MQFLFDHLCHSLHSCLPSSLTAGVERPRCEETRHLLEGEAAMEAEAGDPRVRFTPSSFARAGPGHSRDEVSVYGTPKEEILPHVNNINSSR